MQLSFSNCLRILCTRHDLKGHRERVPCNYYSSFVARMVMASETMSALAYRYHRYKADTKTFLVESVDS